MSAPSRLLPFVLFLGLFISSCMVGPEYKAPELEEPPNWLTQDPSIKPEPLAIIEWWTLFNDPILNDLIQEASENNRDQKIAFARIEEYKALLAMVSGERMPNVNLSAGANRQGSSESGFIGQGTTYSQYRLDVNLSWEVDLFGRVRRSIQAAQAEYEAETEDYTDVMISLYADMALTYFQFRTLQARTQILEDNLTALEQVLQLTQARARHGLATDLEVSQAQSLYASSRAQMPLLRAMQSQAINQLAVLLGKTPQHMQALSVKALPTAPETIASGIPIDLIRQRPDIRRAERQLAAQTARVGLAHSQLYPNLSISALIGVDALTGGKLFDASSGIWSLGVSLGQGLFSGSRLRNKIKVEDARARQALFAYEKTVLQALSEVETAMVFFVEQRNQLTLYDEAIVAARKSVSTANSLYKEGLVDFQNVLDAQRQQLELEDSMATAKGEHVSSVVRLYRALGGGWGPNRAASAITPSLGDH